MFLGNIPFHAEEEDLRKGFEEAFTGVESVRLIRDRVTREGRGFGYVKFSTFEGYKNALKAGTLSFQGRDIRIQKSRTQRQEVVVESNANNAFKRIQKRVDGVEKADMKEKVKHQIKKKIKKIQKKVALI